jgi:hypothetical protein
MATKLILPQILKDIESEVARRERAEKKNGAPWYKKWYKAMQDMLM